MTAISDNFFNHDGSAKIGDVFFRPVGSEDKTKALDDNSLAVICGFDEEKYACYDVFNAEGNQFCGDLDMFYDRGGYMSFANYRKNVNGNYEIRRSILTAELLFGIFNFPKTRSGLTKALMEVAEELHKRNSKSSGWKEIQKNIDPQRHKFNSEGG